MYAHMADHPADRIYHSGVSMSVNTDARTVTPTTLSEEYAHLHKTFGWTLADFRQCNLEAVRHCFATSEQKQRLRAQIEAAYPAR
jgi:adenosine deaminase